MVILSMVGPVRESHSSGEGGRNPRPPARTRGTDEASEAISLVFVTALQLLPSRQRAALIPCGVLGYRVGEAAGMLGTS
jgi:DNA-directed RNA polymerase specialized sigma24 family protein